MGGDSFEGTQKLTNAQYEEITQQLIKRLTPFCQKIQLYIPLPQKQIHGDVDFLIILKPQYNPKDIVQELKMQKQKYKLNNNKTINSVYKNKQIDYYFVKNEKQFQLASFYKSYSGIGAYLGVFLPTKQIKLTTQGIIALGFQKHLKLQFVVCDQISQILKFYGLDYKRYKQGFNNRKQLYQFLKLVRFLDQEKFAYHQHKAPTKLIKGFSQYLKQTGINSQKKPVIYQNALEQTLLYFKMNQQYKKEFSHLIDSTKRVQQLNTKFNATHLFENFEIIPKEVNQIKKKFNLLMFNNDQDKFFDWIENHTIQDILKQFEERCALKPKKKKNKNKNSIQDSKSDQQFFNN